MEMGIAGLPSKGASMTVFTTAHFLLLSANGQDVESLGKVRQSFGLEEADVYGREFLMQLAERDTKEGVWHLAANVSMVRIPGL
jgi:hypothetical protein